MYVPSKRYTYIYMYICTYMCTRKYVCIYTYIDIKMYIYTYMYTKMYIEMYIYTYMYINMYIYKYMYINMNIYSSGHLFAERYPYFKNSIQEIRVYLFVYTCVYISIYIYIHIYICKLICIYICRGTCSLNATLIHELRSGDVYVTLYTSHCKDNVVFLHKHDAYTHECMRMFMCVCTGILWGTCSLNGTAISQPHEIRPGDVYVK